MGANTAIGWCHHTFNPWWGCVRVSPGCEHCYAEAFSHRLGLKLWGPQSARRFFGDAHWNEPRKWDRAAAKAGERHRVFCASMGDVGEDLPELAPHRERLSSLILETPNLDWLLLTKRIENMARLFPREVLERCWVGTTAEDRQRAERRLPLLLQTPALVRFVSYEPALGPVDFEPWFREIGGVDWIIYGDESGPQARWAPRDWARNTMHQCIAYGVPFFLKQFVDERGRKTEAPELDGRTWQEFPKARRTEAGC